MDARNNRGPQLEAEHRQRCSAPSGCWILDYSGIELHSELRLAGVQVDPGDVRPVRIEDKVWLGSGVIVLPGVTIGEGAVIGAATVVTKDVPPGAICVGNPGKGAYGT